LHFFVIFAAIFFLMAHAYGTNPVLIVGSVSFFLVSCRHLLSFMNERIIISEGELIWFDWLSRKRLHVSLTQIVPDTLRRPGSSKGGSIETEDGVLRWQDTITNVDSLLRIIVDPYRVGFDEPPRKAFSAVMMNSAPRIPRTDDAEGFSIR
jgi:hypothetical protein